MKFECESYTGEVAIANDASLANSKLSSEMHSVGLENDIKSVSLVFDVLRLGCRCVLVGGGANEPLLDDVGNDFPLANADADADADDGADDDELPNEPGRGRVNN